MEKRNQEESVDLRKFAEASGRERERGKPLSSTVQDYSIISMHTHTRSCGRAFVCKAARFNTSV